MISNFCRCPECGECAAHANEPRLKAELKRLRAAQSAPAAVPLTDMQLYCAWDEAGSPCSLGVFKTIVRAAERAHGIGDKT